MREFCCILADDTDIPICSESQASDFLRYVSSFSSVTTSLLGVRLLFRMENIPRDLLFTSRFFGSWNGHNWKIFAEFMITSLVSTVCSARIKTEIRIEPAYGRQRSRKPHDEKCGKVSLSGRGE